MGRLEAAVMSKCYEVIIVDQGSPGLYCVQWLRWDNTLRCMDVPSTHTSYGETISALETPHYFEH